MGCFGELDIEGFVFVIIEFLCKINSIRLKFPADVFIFGRIEAFEYIAYFLDIRHTIIISEESIGFFKEGCVVEGK